MTTTKEHDPFYLLTQHLVAKQTGDSEEVIRSKLAIERYLEAEADLVRESAGDPEIGRAHV